MNGCYEWRTLASRKQMVASEAVRLYVLLSTTHDLDTTFFYTYISSGRNTKHEGVEVAVVRREFDDFLEWPARVTIVLMLSLRTIIISMC